MGVQELRAATRTGMAQGIKSRWALYERLDASQWLAAAEIRREQFRAVGRLLEHAWESIGFYRDRIAATGWRPGGSLTEEQWRLMQTLTRQELQANEAAVRCQTLAPGHGKIGASQTSGSTGQPVRFLTTALTRLMWEALTLRHHLWQGDDFSTRLAAIRHGHGTVKAGGTAINSWGSPISDYFETGPGAVADCRQDVGVLLEWLISEEPEYLICLPSTLGAIVRLAAERGVRLSRPIRAITTYAETVTPELRAEVREVWGSPIHDMYSSQEVGYVALQCPDHEHYHAQSESLLVEVLDEAGRACAAGEVGRVVVTSLLNYASPFIRYELGDMAEPGGVCPCGRGLAVIRRILGRRRNLITLPDGRRYWPVLETKAWASAAPVRQIQLVQKTRERFEARLVMDRPPTPQEEAALTDALVRSLGYRFMFDYVWQREWIRGPTGKFEVIVSEVKDG